MQHKSVGMSLGIFKRAAFMKNLGLTCLVCFLFIFCQSGCSNFLKSGSFMTQEEYVKSIENPSNSLESITAFFPKKVGDVKILLGYSKDLAKKELNEILKIKPEDRTFNNTARAFDSSGSKLSLSGSVIGILGMISPDEEIRKECRLAETEIDKFSVDLYLRPEVYVAFKEYVDGAKDAETLNDEHKYFLQESMRDFKVAGLHLPKDKLDEVNEIRKELSELENKFAANIAEDKSSILVDAKDLIGVEERVLSGLEKDGKAFVLKCDYPTYFAVMKDCSVAKTREKLSKLFNNRAYPENIDLLDKIIEKRHTLAQKLGFENFAALNINSCMAKTEKEARKFTMDLVNNVKEKASEEIKTLKKNLPDSVNLTDDGKFEPWDVVYANNFYKKEHFEVDENELSEYFPVDKTLKEMLDIYQEFLGLDFVEIKSRWTWHEDVRIVEVRKKDQQGKLGYLFLDLHPRDGKYSHACQASIVSPLRIPKVDDDGHNLRPSVGMVIANFPKPTADKPALLRYDDVETFFHEFGHAMHSILGATEMAGFAGTSVKLDFVETPSQLFEEWLWNREMLKRVGCHYKTGEPIPDELLDKKIALKKWFMGYFVLRQCCLSLVSLDLFSRGPKVDTDEICRKLNEKHVGEFVRFDPENHFQASFGHLMGYGARYYSYMWSKVYSLDLFYEIKKHGLLNPESGKRLTDKILGKGGSVDPKELLKDFLGRKPNQKAFLDDLGVKSIR
jgi:thimet oligopeptidase